LREAGVRISSSFNEVTVNGKGVELSDIEYQILYLLMKYPNKIFSTENIYESVWQEPFFYGSSNTVMVHIRKLRLKIEINPQYPEHICTVWGKGYRFE
jgi:two-component system OmpR family response regulator